MAAMQNNFLWYNHEKLRRGQYIAQIAHYDKVRLEDAVELGRNNYFHISGSCDSKQQSCMEYLVRTLDYCVLFGFSRDR
jgi:hypothetical protein